MIKVLLADDHSIVRAGLRRIVEESGDMEVVAEAADGRDAIQQVVAAAPDVAVVDISMPGIDGLEVVSRLRDSHPGLPVLILTMHEEAQYIVRAIEAGAMGYLTKQSAPEQLVTAIRRLCSGHRYITDEATEALALRIARGTGIKPRWTRFPCANYKSCAAWPWDTPIGKLRKPTASASKRWTPIGPACSKNWICAITPN